MHSSSKTRWSLGLAALAAVFCLAFYGLPAFSASSTEARGSGKCIQPQQQLINSGLNPSGDPWTITAIIRKNDGCDSWLFVSRFIPAGKVRGSFAFGWGIPAGGHLSNGFTIGARDDSSNSERVFAGMVGARVTRIVVQMSSGGESMTIRPTLPAKKLREKFVWLRDVRYVMRFYPRGPHATKVTLYSADGKVIEQVKPIEGAFTGPGV